MLDALGKACILAVRTEETLDFYADIIAHDTELSVPQRESLVRRETMPFFLTKEQQPFVSKRVGTLRSCLPKDLLGKSFLCFFDRRRGPLWYRLVAGLSYQKFMQQYEQYG